MLPRVTDREKVVSLQKENALLKRTLRMLAHNIDITPFLSSSEFRELVGVCLDELPIVLIHHICLCLPYKSIVAMSEVSKNLNKFCGYRNNVLWMKVYQKQFKGDTLTTPKPPAWGFEFARRAESLRWITDTTPSPIRLTCHEGTITSLKFDNANLVTASDDGTCVLWHLPRFLGGQDWLITGQGLAQHHISQETPKPFLKLCGHSGPVYGVDFQEGLVVSAGYDKTVKVWDMCRSIGKNLCTLRGHTGWINNVAIEKVHAENILFSCSWDGTVRVWKLADDFETGIECHSLANVKPDIEGEPNPCQTMDWNSTRGQIAVGCENGDINVWDIEKGKIVRTYSGHRRECYAVEYRSHLLTSGSKDSSIFLRDTRAKPSVISTYNHKGPVLAMSSDEYKIACGGTSKGIRIFDKRNRNTMKDFYPHSHTVFAIQMSDRFLISGGADMACLLFDWSRKRWSPDCERSSDRKSHKN